MKTFCSKLVVLMALVVGSMQAQAWPYDSGWGGRGRGGPAYSQHYVAPGHYQRHLPPSFARLFVGGVEFFYWEGMFYRQYGGQYVIVNAPVGVVVTSIPPGYQTVVVDGVVYYTINGVTYTQVSNGYQVVPTPAAIINGTPTVVTAPVAVIHGVTPFELSFAAPMQMVPESWDVMGIRVDLIYGCNHNVGFLDVGLLNETTDREYGIQVGGLWNGVLGEMAGIQIAGLVNSSDGPMNEGIQIACFNMAGSMTGMQIGVFNHTYGSMSGLQIGVFNVSDQPLHGAQIGLINLNESGAMPCMPIINCGF